MTKLKYFYVAENQLTSFHMNLLSSTKVLEELRLEGNNLTEIHYRVVKSFFPNLDTLSLNDNLFNCFI